MIICKLKSRRMEIVIPVGALKVVKGDDCQKETRQVRAWGVFVVLALVAALFFSQQLVHQVIPDYISHHARRATVLLCFVRLITGAQESTTPPNPRRF